MTDDFACAVRALAIASSLRPVSAGRLRSGLLALPVLLALVSAVDVAARQDPDPLAPVLAEARALMNAGQANDAIARLRALNSADPRVAQLLGVAYYHGSQYPAAIDTLGAVLDRLAPGSLERREAEQVLGLSLYLAGRFADAVPYLERTRAWADANRELQYALGMAYIQTRRPDEARGALARAFDVSASSPAAHVLAAQMMIRLEFESLAEAELKRALELDRNVPRANYLLGQQAIFRGRLDEGISFTRRELEINPSDAIAYYQLGDAYGRQLKWPEAIAALQQSLWLNPYYSGPYILLGRAYLKKGELQTAEGMLRRAVQYDPNNRTAHYLLGQVLQQLGRAEEAKREFEIAETLPGPRER